MRYRTLFSAIALGLFFIHCPAVPGGNSIGRPYFAARPGAQVNAQIIQVSIDPNNAFVQLLAQEDIDVASTPLHLLTPNSDVALGSDANLTLPANQAVTVAVSELGSLHWTAGEVLLTDATYIPLSYFAWGNSPANFDTGLGATALDANIVVPTSYVPVPIIEPTPRPVLVNDGNQVGCLDAGQNVVSCGTNPALAVQITAVGPVLSDPNSSPRTYSGSWVTLQNNQATAIDLYGMMLCRGPSCVMLDPNSTFDPNQQLAANSAATYYLGQSPDPNAKLGNILSLPAAGYRPTSTPYLGVNEELALAPPGAVPSPNAASTPLWSYVRMGTAATSVFTSTANNQGLWGADGATAASPATPGQALALDANSIGKTPVTATNWTLTP